jgi:hypothetical protein
MSSAGGTSGGVAATAGSNAQGGTQSAAAGTTPQGGAEPTAGGSHGGTGGTGGTDDPKCYTRPVANSTAGEKVNAALCFGVPLDDRYACQFNAAANETRCIGATSAYVVVYSQTADGTLGDIYDLDTGEHLGIVFQASSGEYRLEIDTGAKAFCVVNGDIATLCIEP